MPLSLKGKRILFFAPRFFGYEQDIASHLITLGADVVTLPDRPFDSPLMTAITRFGTKLIIGSATRLYRQMLKQIGWSNCDMVLVVSGQTVSKEFLIELRTAYPSAKFILYMFDSTHNRSAVVSKLTLFDHCFTFDVDDSKKYGIKFRPLFSTSGFERPAQSTFNYHMSFIGTAHTDRYAVISKVAENMTPARQCYWYLFLQAPWVFYAYKITNPAFKHARIDTFRFTPLSKSQVQEIFFKSFSILDVEHPQQTGLTMRTFETIGANKKLVTTNQRIREYDFFDSQNICVIDREHPKLSEDFFNFPYKPLNESLYDKYRLSSWTEEVLSPALM